MTVKIMDTAIRNVSMVFENVTSHIGVLFSENVTLSSLDVVWCRMNEVGY